MGPTARDQSSSPSGAASFRVASQSLRLTASNQARMISTFSCDIARAVSRHSLPSGKLGGAGARRPKPRGCLQSVGDQMRTVDLLLENVPERSGLDRLAGE